MSTTPTGTPNNANFRLARLENAAQKTARMLLGRHDIDVVVGSSPRYAWKEKRLYLPAYSGEASDRRLEMAWRGLVDHECAHVEFSDFEALDVAIDKWTAEAEAEAKAAGSENPSDAPQRLMTLSNVYEDIWIERDWGSLYPGAVEHLRVKNEYLIEKNGGSEVCDPNYIIPELGEPIGMWGAFTQAVLRVGRRNVDLADVHADVKALMAECKDEILEGWAATSTPAVIIAAEKTWAKLKQFAQPMPEPEEGEGEGEGEPGEGEGTGEGEGEGKPGEGEGSGEGEGEGEGSGAPGEGKPGKGKPGKGKPGEGEGESSPGDAGEGPNPNGAGNCSHETRKLSADAVGGKWGEVKSDADVIASKYIGQMPPLYTVHPDAQARDKVITYDNALRAQGRPNLKRLEASAGPAIQRLMGLMRGAVAASRMSRTIGGMEEGEGLDENAIPGIAMGFNDPAIFQTTIREIKESTGVIIQVDCSGSMGSSTPNAKGEVTTKAGYAAITAMALHKALQGVRVPHCVLGYSTVDNYYRSGAPNNRRPGGKHLEWSRTTKGLESHVFVPAPGIYDDGSALPFITGRGCNLDGESIMWAARYGAAQFGHLDRVIMLVIADGLPAGADDHMIEGPYLQQAVELVAHAGIEVYGIGTCIRDMNTFRAYYPDRKATGRRAPTGCIEINAKEGLTSNVLKRLTGLMTRGYGMSRKGRG